MQFKLVGSPNGNMLVGEYPTNPEPYIADILAYIVGPVRDPWKLVKDVYALVGYGIYVVHGDPSNLVSAQVVFDGLTRIVFASKMAKVGAIPSWLLPLLLEVLQAVAKLLNKPSTP